MDNSPINRGKKSYKEYLAEGYGRSKARYLLDPKYRYKIDKLRNQKRKKEGAN